MHLADCDYALSPLNRPPRVGDAAAGLLAFDGRDRVCIYGAGFGRQDAPLDDDEWEVWALNVIPPLDRSGRLRADLWWELHERKAQSADDMRWIAACPVPIMVPDDLMDASMLAVRYPIERVRAAVADGPFACTFSYQIAFALLHGFRHIGLYGVELAYGTPRERTVEWASVNWWMGFAEAKGVTFHLPAFSRMGTHRFLYGLEYDAELNDVRAYTDRMARGDAQEARLKKARASVGG